MGRAIDVCLEQLGLAAAAPVGRRNGFAREPIAAPAGRKNGFARDPIAAPAGRRNEDARDPFAAPAGRRNEDARDPFAAPAGRRNEDARDPFAAPAGRRNEDARDPIAAPAGRRNEDARDPFAVPAGRRNEDERARRPGWTRKRMRATDCRPAGRRNEYAREPIAAPAGRGNEFAREPTVAPAGRGNEFARGPIAAPAGRGSEFAREPIAAPAGRGNEFARELTAAFAGRRSEQAREPTAAPPPPRRRSPIIAPDDPSRINLPRPGRELSEPDDEFRSPQFLSRQLALPSPAGGVRPATSVGQLIESCRVGLTAGVAFLINSEGLPDNDNAPGENLMSRAGRAFENELRTGLRVLLVVGLLAGGWAVLMPLAGAVVVPGNLVVQSNVKAIQHPTGGVVAEIPVNNGQRVDAGDLLLRLDATQAQASLQMVSKQLDEVRARIARLVAERDGLARLEVPAELAARSGEGPVKTLLASEESLFKARANARRSQRDLLQSRVSQLGEEIAGLDAQVESKTKQLELIAGELSGVQDLYDKRLVPLTRLTTLQRESARIDGERGQLMSSIAETKSKIGEAQLQIVRLDQDFRTDVVKELGDSQGKEAELVRAWRRGAGPSRSDRDPRADIGGDPSTFRPHHWRRHPRRRHHHGSGAGSG